MKRMHETPSCFWRDNFRIARIFDADFPGVVLLQLHGKTTDVDEIAREIIERNNQEAKP